MGRVKIPTKVRIPPERFREEMYLYLVTAKGQGSIVGLAEHLNISANTLNRLEEEEEYVNIIGEFRDKLTEIRYRL